MAFDFRLHPEALFEYAEAATYYLAAASPQTAEGFAQAVEAAIATVINAPMRWPVVEPPGIRRYVLKRFPFVLYYRLEPHREEVTVYAIMHCSREPGYWRDRLK